MKNSRSGPKAAIGFCGRWVNRNPTWSHKDGKRITCRRRKTKSCSRRNSWIKGRATSRINQTATAKFRSGPDSHWSIMSGHSRAYYDRMARKFRKNRYLFVKRLLPASMLEYLKIYYAVLLDNELFVRDTQCPSSLSLGGDPGLDAVLEWIRPEIGRLVGFELAPTYSYTRRYAKGELLKRHKDRESCEVSVTVSIKVPKRAAPSVVYLRPPNARATKVAMREGDGYIQLFFHFISKSGRSYPDHLFDGRKLLGGTRLTAEKKA